MAHADSRYVHALIQNDLKVVEEIYARFAGRIERFVCANNGDREDARDIFQEGLLAIARQGARPDFVLTCPFEAFLYMVCRGKWLNELKRRQREAVTISEAQGFADEQSAHALSDALLAQDARDQLFQSFFNRLSAGCRQILQLSWTGISMEEVATQLGISYNYARKRKSECTGQLTESIKASPEFAALRQSTTNQRSY